MLIYSLDPGKTTGFVAAHAHSIREIIVHTSYEIKFSEAKQELTQLFLSSKPDIVVIEDFKLFGSKALAQIGSSFPEIRVIGYIELLAHLKNVPVVFQMPSVQQRVKIDNWKDSLAKSKHVYSAFKHLRYYVVDNA